MITANETSRENLTLTDAELAACQPVAGEGGHVLRALCPFHGSDHQRSLRVHARQRALRVLCVWRLGLPGRSARTLAGRATASGGVPEASGKATPPAERTPRASRLPPCHRRRVRLHQRLQRLRSSSPRSRRPCRAVVAKHTYASAVFRWRWRSSTAWAMRHQGRGRMQHAIGVAGAWSFRIRRRTAAW